MAYIRAAIATTLFVLLGLLGFIYLSFDAEYELSLAHILYEKGQYKEANKTLEAIQGQDVIGRRELYQAYIAREEGNIPLSTTLLEKSLNSSTLPETRLEIYLNAALNAYLQNDASLMKKQLANAGVLAGANNEWVTFFTSLEQQLSNQLDKKSLSWKAIEKQSPLSPWMKTSFEHLFTPFWTLSQQIKELFSEEKYAKARELLAEANKISSADEQDQINLLTAESYIHEAKNKPYNAAAPYWKLAFTYLKRMPIQKEKYTSQKEEITHLIENHIQVLFANNDLEDLPLYLSGLQYLDENKELSQVNEQVTASKSKLLISSANTNASLGLNLEAFDDYQEFLSLKPTDNSFRPNYAKLLIALERYDLALSEYKKIKGADLFIPEYTPLYIHSLINTGNFEEANRVAEDSINQTKTLPIEMQLRIAELMLITANNKLIEQIIKNLSPKDKRTENEEIALVNFYTEKGDYNKALDIITEKREELTKTPKGLMALANFYTKMSNVTEALKLARQAVILDPTNGEIHSFIQEKDKSPQFLELSNSFLKQSIGNEERDWTKKEDYARTLIESTIEKMEASPESNNESLKELQQALEILKKLQLKFDQIPEIHFLLGQVYFLLDDNTNAVNAYKKALNLNISSSESYQFLALEYMLQNQNDKARDALEQALKYSPNNSEAWQQLARLEKRLGNTQEATSSYEKAIKFKPNKLTNYLELGRLLTENGDPNSAKELLESAMKIDSENPQLLKLLLITLQNPELKVTPDERDNIQKQRNNIFNKLQKIGK